MPPPTTPQPRKRKTRAAVHVWDSVAGMVIGVGGFSVIVAVLGICVYLVAQVVPLFKGGSTELVLDGRSANTGRSLFVVSDEYRRSILTMDSAGLVRVTHLSDGATVVSQSIVPAGRSLTAWSFDASTGRTALGFDDGSIQLGTLGFESSISPTTPASAAGLAIGASRVLPANEDAPSGSLVERVSSDQYRVIFPAIKFRAPTTMAHGSGAIRRIDFRNRADNEFVVALRDDGTAEFNLVKTVVPLGGGGAARTTLTSFPIPFQLPKGRGLPDYIFVTGDESSVLTLWSDGLCQRYSSPQPNENPIALAETIELLKPGQRVTTAGMLLGGLTMLIGDSEGEVLGVFAAVDRSTTISDSNKLVVAHRFSVGDSAVTSIGVSTRDRTLVIGDAAGRVTVRHMTSEKEVVPPIQAFTSAVAAATPTPKLDGIIGVDSTGAFRLWSLSPGHPEASFLSLFGKVHYEGAPKPDYVYQSSSGEDTSEIKLSLVPLILGTMKATAFAMLFAVPLGVLAAVYTSEFMDKGVRRIVKPAIEMMASLPSVVLGFIAAIIIAPYVRDWLPAILASFAVIPLGMLLAAYLWQLIPPWTALKIKPTAKLALMFAVVATGMGVASLVGPVLERSLFRPTANDRLVFAGSFEAVPAEQRPAWVGGRSTMSPDEERQLRARGLYFRGGNVVRPVEPSTPEQVTVTDAKLAAFDAEPVSIRRWLDGGVGGPWPGWFLVLMLPSAVLAAVFNGKVVARRFNAIASRHSAGRAALLDLAKFGLTVLAVVGLSALAATFFTALGFDTRDSILGPFSQRNTLVVGIIMGFAIIPIIYTISEDAMASVPDSLRSASLGCGATPWQTAWRVVMPVAASGIFSAVMIGLGRAAGETMIVVMATGNTPSTDWNIFSGFRTLSANIAVELPEAPNGSTHYRVLFLCGLVLFGLTFIVNTLAEVVRQHFRKRSIAL